MNIQTKKPIIVKTGLLNILVTSTPRQDSFIYNIEYLTIQVSGMWIKTIYAIHPAAMADPGFIAYMAPKIIEFYKIQLEVNQSILN